MVTAEIWKLPAIVDRFLSYRGAIPLALEQIAIMMSVLESRPQPVEDFMDLGCGDGILDAAILGTYPSSRGVLVDFSERMLEQARLQLKDHADQLTFLNLDYSDPVWVAALQARSPFDAIVSGYSIHHQLDARKRHIEEIFSLLAPGGWFINVEHIAASAKLTTDLFNQHTIDGRYAIEQRNGGARTREEIADIFLNRPDRDANLLLPVDVQCAWLRGFGFEEVDCFFRVYELAVFGGRRPA